MKNYFKVYFENGEILTFVLRLTTVEKALISAQEYADYKRTKIAVSWYAEG